MTRPHPGLVPAASSRFRFSSSKVASATAMFWVIKVITTGTGETASDYLVTRLDPVLVVGAAGVILLICLVLQLGARRYTPWRYWLLVSVIAVFGTMVADVAHVILGVPYEISTLVFAIALACLFALWWRTEHTVSIHEITTRRRELFYWLGVGLTFALGTAAGDLTARSMGLGYSLSAVLFALIIVVPLIAFRTGLAGAVSTFWAAYIVTRPLGASIADYLAVSPDRGGVGVGTDVVSVAGAATIIVLVIISARRDRSLTVRSGH